MRLKLTLNRVAGPPADIVVTTDAAASISDVAEAIARLDPTGDRLVRQGRGPLTLAATVPGQSAAAVLPPDAPIGESPIGSGATVGLVEAGAAPTGDGPAVARVRVIAGPDAGAEFALSAGTTILGRDAACDIELHDPMVSKRHIRFEASDVVDVVDLGSANGLVVDGGLVQRVRVDRRETLLVGDSTLVVEVAPTRIVSGVVPVKAGPVFFNRSPKVEARYAGEEFGAPEVPTEKENQPFPLLAMIIPLLLGGVMLFTTHQPYSLLFVAMTPVMLVGNYLNTRSRDKRKLKKSIAVFDERLASLSALLGEERVSEHTQRHQESPSTLETYQQALERGPMLWTRRPEHWSFLNVRLGVGAMPSRNTIKTANRGEILQEFQERLDVIVDDHRTIPDVPIIDNLHDAGALGIAGTPDQAAGAVNSVLVQLTGLHSPAELVVAAIVTPAWSAPLEWLKWMPHTTSAQSPISGGHLADGAASSGTLLSALEELVETRLKQRDAAARGAIERDAAALTRGGKVGQEDQTQQAPVPGVVVLISDDAAVDRARLVQLTERAADAGVYPIWIAGDTASLPAACRTYVAFGERPGIATVGFVRLGETIEDVVTEQVPTAHALEFARRMAAVVDAGALAVDSSDLPRTVSLVTLLGHDLAESSDAVVDRWRQNASIHDRSGTAPAPRRAGRLRAIVGSAGVDPMHLDLRAQGPHALVGGTTGAGKSEFLQAWVLGMAAEYSPDRVTFLFVDYKGGSAFADCVELPHCVGLVTDLSPHLVRRALTSLRAELHHREHLLNRKKAKDLLELEKRGDPECPPALVLVIDEFAALVGEVPEFVDGVVDIAQRGRSLGIHLIMATQRPAGVIRDNLRANTNLRVALRMADESDSDDVVGVKDAAHFDPGLPGRGMAKTGPGRLALFQSGYAGGWTSREPEQAAVEVAELRFGGEVRWEEPSRNEDAAPRDPGPTDQQRLVASMRGAQRVASIPAPRRPWLDELAAVYDLSLLRQRTDAQLLLGVADMPERQQQAPVSFDPDTDGNIAIFGTGGSGKSVALRTLACAAAITPRGGPVHVYALDFGAGGLRMLEQLPHVGAVIGADDAERTIRLLRMLKGQLEDRAARFAAANAASITEYRRLANRPDEPRILLLVDGFPNFRDDYETAAGRSQWYDVFRDVLSDGRQLGIHVAMTADRAGAVPTSVASSIQKRVVLRLADDGYSLLDVPGDILSPSSPAGRAVVDGYETQLAVLGGTRSVSEQAAHTAKFADAMRRAGVSEVPRIGAMPVEYAQSELPSSAGGRPVLGIGESDLGALGFEPSGTMLLAGPPASGRTTAIAAVAEALGRFDPAARLYFIGGARSPLVRARAWAATATSPEEAASLARNLEAAITDPDTEGRIGVFVEAIGDYLQSSADMPLVELIKAVRRSDHFMLAEAETSAWGSSWPLLAEVKNGRRGLLLQPEALEGDLLLKTPLPRMQRAEFPPGRGVYIAKGGHERAQLPMVG
ncbi:FtsK/SpoIIIE domain-containing protein [Microbacterium sp. ASV49]|uniref:FtsK/SpoIIIE domain-containing protein n=1 Tax=Microbacterium candidum TaxID=3041922 RepID=A0ABT7MUR6_9MICO|nr:FtsK/SpoIIIE domain-containing protein [Microbacterium sp. ASV49]MDL9978206.1 FtsK/SpoIIIE domain-containing protein [Microbacterium sp. ASV49]